MSEYPTSPYAGLQIVDGPFQKNGMPNMWTAAITNKRQLESEDQFFVSFANAYRDAFGHGAPVDNITDWHEYMYCERCGNRKSIEEVYNIDQYQTVEYLEREKYQTTTCEDCDINMQYFFQTHNLIKIIRHRLFDKEAAFGSILLDENGRIYGFFLAWIETLQNAWEETWSTFFRENNISLQAFLADAEKNSTGMLLPDTYILHMGEVAQTLPSRHGDAFFSLLNGMFTAIPNEYLKLMGLGISKPQIRTFLYLIAAGCSETFSIPNFNNQEVILHGPAQKIHDEYALGLRGFIKKHAKLIRQCQKDLLPKNP